MKNDQGLDVIKRLADESDILLETFRPGVLERLGLNYDDLATRNPGIIWASISGFGQNGPDKNRPAYDMIVQAISGGMGMTGEPGRSPVRSGIPIGDLSAGMYAVIGSLAALQERGLSGKGQFIDISMLDCQVSMLCYQAAYFLHSGINPGRQGWGHDSIPTYRGFNCANGTSLVITANTERMWQSLCDVLEIAALKEDRRFILNEDRYANRHELWPILEGSFMVHEAEYWVPRLLAAEIPVGEINSLEKAFSNPQVLYRDMVLSLEEKEGETVRVAGNPIKMSRTTMDSHSYPPKLGAQSVEILTDVLGANEEEVARLVASGAVREFVSKTRREIKVENVLKLDQDGEIARITIDRPEKGNMLTLEMLDYVSALIIDAGCDPDIKAISLTSTGDDFCLGRDPQSAPENSPKNAVEMRDALTAPI